MIHIIFDAILVTSIFNVGFMAGIIWAMICSHDNAMDKTVERLNREG